MDTNLTFNLNEVFREVITRMEDDGAFTKEAYDDLIDEIIEHKIERGELDAGDDVEEYKEQLRARWPEAEASFETGHDSDILEQE